MTMNGNPPVRREWLVGFRKLKKMTQHEVTQECRNHCNIEISRTLYANFERGERRPTPEKAQAIGAILGFPWTFFYTQECSVTEQSIK